MALDLARAADLAEIDAAADALAAGELVALPTETVYGLGARADDAAAVQRIYAAKGRPADHPLIVHVADLADAAAFAADVPAAAARLMAAFWPGPLSLVLRRRSGVADAAAAGLPTIALRCPAHPVAAALLAAARRRGVPGVAAPSANRFGRVSPTQASHVGQEFGAALRVLDGGACPVGIESSIVDVSGDRLQLLRPGILATADIEAAAGEPLHAPGTAAPRVPGSLASHYAPQATVRLMPTATLAAAIDTLGPAGGARGLPVLAVYSRTLPLGAAHGLRHRRMPADPARAAHELFAVMREFDAEGVQLLWIEAPPPGPEWDGVRDRITRASTR